jgi:hypothetical protein
MAVDAMHADEEVLSVERDSEIEHQPQQTPMQRRVRDRQECEAQAHRVELQQAWRELRLSKSVEVEERLGDVEHGRWRGAAEKSCACVQCRLGSGVRVGQSVGDVTEDGRHALFSLDKPLARSSRGDLRSLPSALVG